MLCFLSCYFLLLLFLSVVSPLLFPPFFSYIFSSSSLYSFTPPFSCFIFPQTLTTIPHSHHPSTYIFFFHISLLSHLSINVCHHEHVFIPFFSLSSFPSSTLHLPTRSSSHAVPFFSTPSSSCSPPP